MIPRRYLFGCLFFMTLGVGIAPYTYAEMKIKKCQDAQGRWHYGDSAAAACEESKIIELSGQGVKTREIAAPLTAQELKERERNKEQLEKQKLSIEDQERKDRLLLSSYGHEDDINFVRDRKIAELESQIKASEETLKSLRAVHERLQAQAVTEQRSSKDASEQTAKSVANTEAQISKHELFIASKKKEQEDIRKQYQADLERYRELKSQQSTATPATPAPQ